MNGPAIVVVDTSVAAKWFMPEEATGVAEALHLLEQHRDRAVSLVAPSLIRLELLNALKRRELRENMLLEAADIFEAYQLEVVEISALLAREAVQLALRCGLTVYDATFAALAASLDAELVTADRGLAARADCCTRLL